MDKIVEQLEIITRTLQLVEDRTSITEQKISDLSAIIRQLARKQSEKELGIN